MGREQSNPVHAALFEFDADTAPDLDNGSFV